MMDATQSLVHPCEVGGELTAGSRDACCSALSVPRRDLQCTSPGDIVFGHIGRDAVRRFSSMGASAPEFGITGKMPVLRTGGLL